MAGWRAQSLAPSCRPTEEQLLPLLDTQLVELLLPLLDVGHRRKRLGKPPGPEGFQRRSIELVAVEAGGFLSRCSLEQTFQHLFSAGRKLRQDRRR